MISSTGINSKTIPQHIQLTTFRAMPFRAFLRCFFIVCLVRPLVSGGSPA